MGEYDKLISEIVIRESEKDKEICYDEESIGCSSGVGHGAFTWACGKKESKTVAVFGDITQKTGYHMDMEMDLDGQAIRMNLQAKDDVFYAEATISAEKVLMIRNADGFFVLLPSMKMGIKLIDSAEMDKAVKDIGAFMEIGENAKKEKFESGEMDVDGGKYYFEEFSDGNSGQKARFLFEKEDLRYILIMNGDSINQKIKIYSMDTKIDDNVFKVPEGYTITDGNL